MLEWVAGLLGCAGIAAVLWLDRDEKPVSKATWIPTIWFLIACSRPLGSWITFAAPSGNEKYVEGSPFDRTILSFFIFLALVAVLRRTKTTMSIVSRNYPLLIFFGYCAVSASWGDYPIVSLKRWFRTVGDVLMLLVIVTDPNWRDALKRVLTRVVVILIPMSIIFIRFFPALGRAYSFGGAPMWTGVATDKNALGALCMIAGVVLIWRYLTLRGQPKSLLKTRQIITIVTLMAMVLYLIIIVNSQTALACFAMAMVLVVFTHMRAFRNPVLISLLGFGMVISIYAVLFLGIGKGALESIGRNSSLTGRTEVWQIVLPFAENAWIGAGYENFWVGKRYDALVRAVGSELNQAHNGYIEVYLNIGWVGLLLLATFAISGYRNILQGMRLDPEMARLKLAFFFICLVYNFTEASFKMMSPVWLLFLWSCMYYPKSIAKRAEPAPRASREAPGLVLQLHESHS